jgi:hypothetical protein
MKSYNHSDMKQPLTSQVDCGLRVFCVQRTQGCRDLSPLSSIILFRPLQEIDCLALWESEYG